MGLRRERVGDAVFIPAADDERESGRMILGKCPCVPGKSGNSTNIVVLRTKGGWPAEARHPLSCFLAIHVDDSLVELLLAGSALGLAYFLTVSIDILECELAFLEFLALAGIE